MALLIRELEINYGGFLIGGSTARQIDGHVQIEKTFTGASVEFYFLVKKDNDADFATEIAAIETAFRKVRQDCTVKQNLATLASFSQTTYSGFDSFPTVFKREDIGDTGRSRRYGVKIEFGMPADVSATSGRRSSTVNVYYSPSRRRTVTLSGIYTALSSVASRAQYTASIDAFAASVLGSLGGTYELVEEPTTESNIGDTLLTFTRTYQELIYPQGNTLNDPAIVKQTLTFTRHKTGPGDSSDLGTVNRLIEMSIQYDAWIDKDVTQDLVGKWNNTIRAFILRKAKEILSSSAVAVVDEYPVFDGPENKISARMELKAAGASTLLESEVSTQDARSTNIVVVPLWAKSGNPYTKYVYQGPSSLQRTVTERRLFLSTAPINPFSTGTSVVVPDPPGHDGFSAKQSYVISETETRKPKVIGIGSDFFETVEFEKITVLGFYENPDGFTYTPPSRSNKVYTSVATNPPPAGAVV